MLSFSLLGRAKLSQDKRSLEQFRSQKEPALLIYLAQNGQTFQREHIAELFWDGRSTQQALSNLRTALARLRKQVGDELLVTRKTLALTPECLQQVDSVNLLQRIATSPKIDSIEKADTLQSVLSVYQGDFLANFELRDSPRFDAWVHTTREHIRQQVTHAYHGLAEYALSSRNIENGIDIARRWLQVDALDEQAHTLLIRFLLESGSISQATAHYESCSTLLRAELNIDPPAAMTALIRSAQSPIVSPLADASAHPRMSQPLPHPTRPHTIRHNLPTVYNEFFGRKQVQQELHARLDQPWCRLVTITGPGGAGKTRLATMVARSRLTCYPDGVWFVDLANVDPDDDDLMEAMAVEIATAMELRLGGAAMPVAQLLEHLHYAEALLVLDNFEHLIEGVPLLMDMMQRCEKVQCLVTSREALRLQAEWSVPLTGLSYLAASAERSSPDGNPSSDAVDLFAARYAQRQRGVIPPDERAAMADICRMIEGMPLAIELAASLTHQKSCRAIAEELRHGFDVLVSSLRDVPERHRSLQMVFEMSWCALTPPLQEHLARLSIFRGGFTEAAALQIAEASAAELRILCDKSLLVRDEAQGRYALHATVRAYAAEKLTAPDQTLQTHAAYYLDLLACHTEPLQSHSPQQSITVIHPDIENIRMAWRTALALRRGEWLSAALTSLSTYYQLRGLSHEGEAVMEATARAAETWHEHHRVLAVRAGLEQARFQNRRGRYRLAAETAEQSLVMAEDGGDEWAAGMAQVLWGESLWRLGEYSLAQNRLSHAREIADLLADAKSTRESRLLVGWVHHHLGIIDDIQGRHGAALAHLAEACDAWRAIDYAQALSGSLNSIGLVCYNQGNVPASIEAMEEALRLCDQIDNRHLKSILLNNLSMTLIEQGDYLSAHHYLHRSLELATANGNRTSQGEIHANLGKNYRLLGKTDLAVESLARGIEISESIGNRALKAVALLNFAMTRNLQGDTDGALTYYHQALEIAQQDNLQRIECEVLIDMAEFYRNHDEHKAKQCSEQAVVLAQEIQNEALLTRAAGIKAYLSVS